MHVEEAQQLQTWEGEGGQSVFSTEPLRILSVDNDARSADSLDVAGFERYLLKPVAALHLAELLRVQGECAE